MEPAYYFSVLFFFASVISGFLGAYTLYLDPKAGLNRSFFALCVSLSIWALGFSISVSADNQTASLLWRRISVIGWGSFFSVLLHFALFLTEKKSLLNQWWLYPPLYIPSFLTIYIYGISDAAESKYELIQSVNGWINVPDTGFNTFYNYYYITFSILTIGMIWLWGRKATSLNDKKKAWLIFFYIVGTLILATFTDIVASTFFNILIPQMAPFVSAMSMIVIYYAIKKYGLMKPEKAVADEENILKESTRGNLVNYLAFILFACSIVNTVSFFLFNVKDDSTVVLWSSMAILLLGIGVLIVKKVDIQEKNKGIFYIIVCVLAIPLLTLRFVTTGGITVWVFPIIFAVFALIFNKRIVLVALGISIISTQIMIWLMAPQVKVEINAQVYLTRIFCVLVFLWVAFYVNKLYVRRLKENVEQVKLQKLISNISSDLIAAKQMNLEYKINRALEKCGQVFEMDRVWIYLQYQDEQCGIMPFVWYQTKKPSEEGKEYSLKQASIPSNLLSSGKIIHIPDAEQLSTSEKNTFSGLITGSTKSMICLPIVENGEVLGLFGLESARTMKKWREDQIDLLEVISNILGDALAKVRAEKEIEQLAYYDHLTKLPNRALFRKRANEAIRQADLTNSMIAVIFLDLDSFKTVNDTIGHEGGDELIRKVGLKLLACIRKTDTVSRFGGDEFLILLNDISDYKDVRKIADSILALLAEPIVLRDQEFFVTASVGIALYPNDGLDTETLIKNSDIAMYKAKEKGKNQYALCSDDMKEEVRTNIMLTNSLYRAIERNELYLHYQPQVRLPEGEIIGLEALLRWSHPDMGVISPDVFIPIAEQGGMINTIGEWVLRKACEQNKIWQNKGYPRLRMAVNISVKQLRNPYIIDQIANTLVETGLQAEYLELEITEGSLLKGSTHIVRVLNEIKKLGITLSIDDFGTEYSSLNRLKNLPIDRLKLDMQFVQGIEGDEKDRAIIRVIINLAKNLGLQIIAEGVETEKQVHFLTREMCKEVQGYYYYEPMPAEDIEELLNRAGSKIG
ncbi:EAL domain-containing protein [Dehalobacter sp. DCM]|uniref:EAL domain-containing protein n=1 Tax=Dehalobacter sp. DCM TaxID=2907827 RepID=UPI003081F163|nr:EAL domain-containing protein [Dehalobacter sp. DCM]